MLALSWGLGLQSTTLLEMSVNGDVPKLDYAIFADTGFEHEYSYDVYSFYAPRAIKAGIQVVKIGGQDIYKDNFNHVTLPLFINGTDRMIRRKCTRDYKIRPIQRKIRELLGVKQRGRLIADLVTLWLGITTDEIERAKPSRVAFINHKFPLLDMGFKRSDCTDYLKARELPVPGKSSCVFCPFKSWGEWSEMSQEEENQIGKLQSYINDNGLVKIRGQEKKMSFLPFFDFLEADFSVKNPRSGANDGEMCDGGYCHS